MSISLGQFLVGPLEIRVFGSVLHAGPLGLMVENRIAKPANPVRIPAGTLRYTYTQSAAGIKIAVIGMSASEDTDRTQGL